MRIWRSISTFALLYLAACGQQAQDGDNLEAAAEQSDATSAAILRNAADNGMDPQAALEQAGNAASVVNTTADGMSVQARPNLPSAPNRKDGTTAPDKVATPVPKDGS